MFGDVNLRGYETCSPQREYLVDDEVVVIELG
jgi:hypothetical protein